MGCKVELDVYAGPLDLLLYLVRREEVDIRDIPIARIAEQYLSYIQLMENLDIELAGEYLVMAATLAEIKSRMLLPRPPAGDDEEPDPRLALVEQLLEYKKYRDAAEALERMRADRQKMFDRGLDERELRGEEAVELEEVSVWDLFGAFQKVLDQLGVDKTRVIFDDDVPVAVHMEQIMNLVETMGRVSFFRLFEGAATRATLVGVFLAILELVRLKRIRAFQPTPFGDIFISPRKDTNAERENGIDEGSGGNGQLERRRLRP